MTTSIATKGTGGVLVAVLVAALLLAVPQRAEASSSYLNVDQRDVDSFAEAGVSIAQSDYDPASTDAVVLATDANFPDGLTASAVASAVGGPVLFSSRLVLPEITAEEIDRLLDPGDTVYVMGGSAAISDGVTEDLEEDYTVERIEGATRLETAAAAMDLVGVPDNGEVLLARAFGPDGANTPSDRSTGWVDAISCGAYAAANDIPILLTETTVLSTSTSQALARSDAEQVTVCGGPAAVGEEVLDGLRALGLTVDRVEGPTRVETAVAAAQELFGYVIAGLRTYTVINGYGENFGYGLAAAPLGHPILLVGTDEPTSCSDGSQPSRQTLCYLATGTETNPAQILLMGDSSVISDAVADAVGDAAGGTDINDLARLGTPTGVTAVDDINDDGTRATVRWSAVADPDDIMAGYAVYVDGAQVGTAPEGTTSFEVTGLTEGEEVEVEVSAVDVGDRESARSDAATVTPDDEIPSALTGVVANPGNGSATVSWDPAVPDADRFTITRAVDEPAGTLPPTAGGCTDFTALTTVEDGTATSFTDNTAVNGTGYCYRITVTDTAGQTSAPVTTDPVVPAVGVPSASIQYPISTTDPGFFPPFTTTVVSDTVHAGEDLVIEYTIGDTDDALADLRVTWEVSVDGGETYTAISGGSNVAPTIVDAQSGAATFTVPPCPISGAPPAGCITDSEAEDGELRYRVIVVDPDDNAFRTNTGDLDKSQAPGPVTGLVAVPGDASLTARWDRKDNHFVDQYRVAYLADDGESVADCPTSGYPTSGTATRIVDQPDAVASGQQPPVTAPPFTGLDNTDTLYCVQVVPLRLDPALAGPGVRAAADPEDGLGGVITIAAPGNNTAVDRGQQETITYEIDLPTGVTASEVSFSFCVDYDDADDTCDSSLTPVPQSALDRTPPTTEGRHSVRWRVPADSSTQQGDEEFGALLVSMQTNQGADGDIVVGLIFR